MSARMKRNLPLLQMMYRAKPSVQKAILKGAFSDLINAMCECSHNIFKGHVRLTPLQKQQLCRHKRSLRALVKRGTSLKRKKQVLQKGGFVGALLKPVLGILGGLLGV